MYFIARVLTSGRPVRHPSCIGRNRTHILYIARALRRISPRHRLAPNDVSPERRRHVSLYLPRSVASWERASARAGLSVGALGTGLYDPMYLGRPLLITADDDATRGPQR